MSEAFGTYRTSLHSLQVIVADSSGSLHAGGDIGVVNDLSLCSAMRPHACKAIRLQL
jgi:hypothetical protein